MGGIVNVHVDIVLLGNLECMLHLEAVTAGNAKASQQLIDVGRAVRRAHLDGLLLGRRRLTPQPLSISEGSG